MEDFALYFTYHHTEPCGVYARVLYHTVTGLHHTFGLPWNKQVIQHKNSHNAGTPIYYWKAYNGCTVMLLDTQK